LISSRDQSRLSD